MPKEILRADRLCWWFLSSSLTILQAKVAEVVRI